MEIHDSITPQEGDSTVRLPVTFDYTGGARQGDKRGKILTAIILPLVGILVSVIIGLNSRLYVVEKLIFIVGLLYAILLFLRFITFKEGMYSDAYETIQETDGKVGEDVFWKIYEIEDVYPYICHYTTQSKGIFVRFEKDVMVGKPDNILDMHFQGIAEGLRVAGSNGIHVCHMDYMDNVGNDVRMKELNRKLDLCENPELRKLVMGIYSNLVVRMSHVYASYDTYVFRAKKRPDELWYIVDSIISEFDRANYCTHVVLDAKELRATAMALFNLKEFSAKDACNKVLEQDKFRGIKPIKLQHSDGEVEVFNLTREEKEQQAIERKRLEEEKRKNKKQGKQLQQEVKQDTIDEEVFYDEPLDKSDEDFL